MELVAIWASTIAVARLLQDRTRWFCDFLSKHGPDETGGEYEAVCFAADSIWMGLLVDILPDDRKAVEVRLLSLLGNSDDGR